MTEFEGRQVAGCTLKLKAGEFGTDQAVHHDDEVYVLVRATVCDVQHPLNRDEVMVRRQVLTPDEGWAIPAVTAAKAIDVVEPPKLAGISRNDEANGWSEEEDERCVNRPGGRPASLTGSRRATRRCARSVFGDDAVDRQDSALDEACKRQVQREQRRDAFEAALVVLGIVASLCGTVLAVVATVVAVGWLL